MRTIVLPVIGTDRAWRDAARGALAAGLRPEEILWSRGRAEPTLFDDTPPPPPRSNLTVPRAFLDLANHVVWHRDPERFARLYALLVRVVRDPSLMADRADPQLARLRTLEKNVRRCMHKMKAFVRFVELPPDGPRRRFAAWFEPTHFTLEPTAPFFARRFGDMDWSIVTPDLTAHFEGGRLRFAKGGPRPDLPHDASEELWTTYFRNIFNPARVKLAAMRSEMPRKYWHNLPEARAIPELVAGAERKVREMRDRAPTLPPLRAERIAARLHEPTEAPPPADTLAAVASGAQACTRCPIWRDATQAVPGEGPADADLMIVGEQPGDQEDLQGRPFVGPAGQLFDRVAREAGLDRAAAYVTNAVKHFTYQLRGKRRIHLGPTRGEVAHCRFWLLDELRLVKPRLVVALGATALDALTGQRDGLLKRRGRIEDGPDGTPVFVTVHPSYILRLPSPAERAAEEARFRDDLVAARLHLERLST